MSDDKKPHGGYRGMPAVDAKIDARFFRPAPGREPEVITALMDASKAKNGVLIQALKCLRSMKIRVDGVCWGDRDEAALRALEDTATRFALEDK